VPAARLRLITNNPPQKSSHTVEWIIWAALAITVIGIGVAFVRTRFGERLDRPLFVSASVPAFSLTNQFGRPFGLSNLLGHVVVADAFFTRCPILCERMSQRMHALQDQLGDRANVRFVSLTVDPGYDTPPVLRQYAGRHGADSNRWFFLTGPKADLTRLEVNGLKFVVLDKDEGRETPEDLFVHSTKFVLIDKQGRIRGYFEGTDDHEREQLAIAAKMLAREK